ncbi:MAG: helical backbone metal receptor [Chloroflexi bacterium]|nr:helical backbone metal receptor [Chloroflexota bacterium]
MFSIITAALCAGLLLAACAPQSTPSAMPAVENQPAEATAEPTLPPQPTPTPEPSPTAAGITLTDGLAREVTLAQPAQKIASLAPSNTEILFAIGAGAQVVARDAFSDYPAETQPIADIGGGWGELDTEKLLSLQPDLVLAAQINTPEQVQALQDLGLTVYYLANPKNLEGMYENLRIVAQLSGHEAETETLIASLQQRVTAVDEKVAPLSNHPVVFYELDGTDPNAPWTSGPGTFIDLLIARAGGANLGNALASDWAQISLEELVTQNPQIILLGDAVWGGVTAEAVAARAGWETITAVQSSAVFPFDDNLVSRPGPRMVDGLEALFKLLHPEAAE